MNKIKALYRKFRHFILYAIIGTVSTGVEFGIYALLCNVMPYVWANVIGFHTGIVCSFLLNRSYNFKKTDNPVMRFTAFYIIQLVCLGLNTLSLYLFVDLGHWSPIIGKCFATAITAILPFFLNKYYTFRTVNR